jgi:hypothetical protein
MVEQALYPTRAGWRGDASLADGDLRKIVSGLEELRRVQPATAIYFDAPKQDPTPPLLPGVADAIKGIERARAGLGAKRQNS